MGWVKEEKTKKNSKLDTNENTNSQTIFVDVERKLHLGRKMGRNRRCKFF